jgi:hypothetical protein
LVYDPKDLITSKQGYSDRKLARNHNAKNLIELRIMYMRSPTLYPENEVDLRAQGALGAGAWLSLPSSNTTINDDVVQQDPRWEVAYKVWAGVPMPPEVALSRHLHTVNTVHVPQKEAVPLSLSHLLSCTKGGHCNGRHNDGGDESSKMCRTADMQVSRDWDQEEGGEDVKGGVPGLTLTLQR